MVSYEELEAENRELKSVIEEMHWRVKFIHNNLEDLLQKDRNKRWERTLKRLREEADTKHGNNRRANMEEARGQTPLGDLELTVRTHNALKFQGNIFSVEQLTRRTRAELLKLEGIGRKAINEIEDLLAARGLKLKGEEE